MTPEQAKQKFGDFFADLAGVTEPGLAAACRAYRTNPANTYFPTPGKLLALCNDDLSETVKLNNGIAKIQALLDEPGASEEAQPMATVRDIAALRQTLERRSVQREQDAEPNSIKRARAGGDELALAEERKAALRRNLAKAGALGHYDDLGAA